MYELATFASLATQLFDMVSMGVVSGKVKEVDVPLWLSVDPISDTRAAVVVLSC